jgi:hypothetical protein
MGAATFRTLPLRVAVPADPRSLPAFRLIALQAALIVALLFLTGFGYDGRDINTVAALIAIAVGIGFYLRWRGLARLATAIEAMAAILASSVAVACLSLLVATFPVPLADPTLAAADRLLFPFLSWREMALGLAPHHGLVRAMCAIYSTLLWQPFVLIAALALTGREGPAWRFVHAWLLTLLICIAVFAIAPALTPYVHYGITPADVPALTVNAGWRPAEIIGHIRDGSIHTLSSSTMSGLITFPSFHSAGAVLLGWEFRRVPIIGWAFVALNAAMLATIPFVGSHYFVDVLGGVAVAALAIALTRRAGQAAIGVATA